MKKVYERSFKIIAALFIFVVCLAIGFQAYLYFKNYEVSSFQKSKTDIQNDSAIITKKIKQLGATKFDLFKVSERFSTFKKINDKINYFSEKLNLENEFSNNENLENLSDEISDINHSNQNIWQKYTESFLAYNGFVKKNNWKTLSRISNRISIRSPRNFSFDKDINYLLGINLKDLSLAQDVTKKSSLSIDVKKEVLDKTDNLIILTNLLIEENSKASKVRNLYLLVMKNFESWSNFWSKSGQQALSMPNSSAKVSTQFFVISLTLLVTLLILSLYLMRRIFISFQEKSQREIIFALDKIIVKDDLSFISSKEEDFKNAVQTLNNYVKRRMSLGQIFQQTVPFPCILLDENLNFKWFNQNFMEQLNLSEESLNSDNLNWDNVKGNFFLDDQDPILEAIEGNVAGIFQVKSQEEKSFQMYINPIQYNSKKYVMVLLYPLLTVEETINLQLETSLSPVRKTVSALSKGEYNQEFSQKMKSEFTMTNGIDLWENFEILSKSIKKTEDDFEKEMQNFEKVTIEALNNSEYTTEVLDACKSEVNKLQAGFSSLKEVIVNFSSKMNETIYSSRTIFSEIFEYTDNFSNSVKKDIDLDKTINKLITWGIPSIGGFKSEIKSYRDKLKLIGKIENIEAQEYFHKQEKLLRDTDLFFTKFEMFLSDLEKLSKKDSSWSYDEIENLREKVLSENELIQERIEDKSKSEEELVALMKSFYGNVVNIQKTYKNFEQRGESANGQSVQH